MKFLLALLAVLVLIEAGAGSCQTAHAAVRGGHDGHAARAAATEDEDTSCHETGAANDAARPGARHHAPASGDHACGGGAACLDCALLVTTLASAPEAPLAPEPGVARGFAPMTAPGLLFAFEPPPPKA